MPVCFDKHKLMDRNIIGERMPTSDETIAHTGSSDWSVICARFPATYLDDGWVINFPIVNTFAESKFIRFLLVNPIIEIGRVKLRLVGIGTHANRQKQ